MNDRYDEKCQISSSRERKEQPTAVNLEIKQIEFTPKSSVETLINKAELFAGSF